MTDLDTSLFPFPHFFGEAQRDGSIIPWPDRCRICGSRACLLATTDEIGLCAYGFNFARVDPNVIVGGILVRDYPGNSKARGKRIRSGWKQLVSLEMVRRSLAMLRSIEGSIQATVSEEKQRLINDYVQTEQYKKDFLAPLREEIQRGLSFAHDYKQINAQISQNINVIIESRYSGDTLEDKLTQASPEEKAIYEAAKFLDEKLNVAKFLMHPEWLDVESECVRFRVHGLVHKYVGIYTPRFQSKNIQVSFQGRSYTEVVANPQAVAVVPHTLIDNAAKYSPKGGRVDIDVQDVDGGVDLAVSSYGPRILPKETERIFQPFFRGECAQRQEQEGAGYGLYVSQLVADRHLGTRISVKQEERQMSGMGHWTTFSVHIPMKAKVVGWAEDPSER
jgi:signal transduction histidine kinase